MRTILKLNSSAVREIITTPCTWTRCYVVRRVLWFTLRLFTTLYFYLIVERANRIARELENGRLNGVGVGEASEAIQTSLPPPLRTSCSLRVFFPWKIERLWTVWTQTQLITFLKSIHFFLSLKTICSCFNGENKIKINCLKRNLL